MAGHEVTSSRPDFWALGDGSPGPSRVKARQGGLEPAEFSLPATSAPRQGPRPAEGEVFVKPKREFQLKPSPLPVPTNPVP